MLWLNGQGERVTGPSRRWGKGRQPLVKGAPARPRRLQAGSPARPRWLERGGAAERPARGQQGEDWTKQAATGVDPVPGKGGVGSPVSRGREPRPRLGMRRRRGAEEVDLCVDVEGRNQGIAGAHVHGQGGPSAGGGRWIPTGAGEEGMGRSVPQEGTTNLPGTAAPEGPSGCLQPLVVAVVGVGGENLVMIPCKRMKCLFILHRGGL